MQLDQIGEAVGSIGSSERGTFAALYQAHVREIRGLAFLLTGSEQAAEDLAQEAFIRVFGRLVHLRNPSSVEAYLRRTVVNLARMQFRHKAVERRYLAAKAAEAPTATDHDVVGLERLREALAELPYRQRAAVVLRFYADRPDEEIAELLGCATATVRSLISRAMPVLREVMGNDDVG